MIRTHNITFACLAILLWGRSCGSNPFQKCDECVNVGVGVWSVAFDPVNQESSIRATIFLLTFLYRFRWCQLGMHDMISFLLDDSLLSQTHPGENHSIKWLNFSWNLHDMSLTFFLNKQKISVKCSCQRFYERCNEISWKFSWNFMKFHEISSTWVSWNFMKIGFDRAEVCSSLWFVVVIFWKIA
jgi:hypothetical protein